jgi:hypothetical protein
MIARITSKATHVSICTPPYYKHLFLKQKIWTLEGKPPSTLLVNAYLSSTFFKTTQNTLHTSPYTYYTQNYEVSVGSYLQREFPIKFTACILLLVQTEILFNDMYILSNCACNLTTHIISTQYVSHIASI